MQCITFDDLVSSPDKKFLKLFTPSFTSVEDQEEDPTTQDRQCIIYHLKYRVLRNLPSNSHGSHPSSWDIKQTNKDWRIVFRKILFAKQTQNSAPCVRTCTCLLLPRCSAAPQHGTYDLFRAERRRHNRHLHFILLLFCPRSRPGDPDVVRVCVRS